jgi:hypothetical protein
MVNFAINLNRRKAGEDALLKPIPLLIVTLFKNQINNFQQIIGENDHEHRGRGFPLVRDLRRTSKHTGISWYV